MGVRNLRGTLPSKKLLLFVEIRDDNSAYNGGILNKIGALIAILVSVNRFGTIYLRTGLC